MSDSSHFDLTAYLPAGISVDMAVSVLAGTAALLALIAILDALRYDGSFDRRLKEMKERRDSLRKAQLSARSARPGLHNQGGTSGLMHLVVQQFNLLKSREATDAKLLLARAGLRSPDAMVTYLFCRMIMPLAFGAVVLVDAYLFQIVPIPDSFRLFACLGGVFLGYLAPGTYMKNLGAKRRQLIQKALPDALDLLVICVEAGLSLDAAFARVSKELGRSYGELADEFAITSAELTFLPERRQALDNLSLRVDLPALRGVVGTLQQAEKFGTPLANSLRVLSTEFRDQRMMRAEEKAARLPAVLTVPMMIFILPTLFIVLIGPAILSTLDTLHHM
ncbi:MAG TPA: type II secretion system F family protein [Aliidongia sp.]|nr:type II secretion system F family protein [Aliidongia sp.]